jgi:hypothetical protein
VSLAARASDDLSAMQVELVTLRQSVGPLLPLCPALGWAPVVGGDLAALPVLLQAAEELVDGALLLAEAAGGWTPNGGAAAAVGQLYQATPQLLAARDELARAMDALQRVDTGRLSTSTARMAVMLEQAAEDLRTAADGALLAGRLLGSPEPRRSLVLVQNEDELRATGGFISAAALMTVQDGRIMALAFEDSYSVDDLSKPYFAPPAVIRDYMGADLWLFRDANWSPDFPTAADKAAELYAYGRGERVDGVIALDGQGVQALVEALQPLEVAGADALVTADTLQAYMRGSWSPDGGDPTSDGWWEGRKDFMHVLAAAMLARLPTEANPTDGLALAQAVLGSLEERHVQMWAHDSIAADVLAVRGWDGRLQVRDGDFLMVVDTNIGFNKVNPNIRQTLRYSVDLTQLNSPMAGLGITYEHLAASETPCRQEARYGSDYADMMARCYWDYLRVLAPAGSDLLSMSPAPLPAGSLALSFRGLPADHDTARVGETPDGLTSFEQLLVVPGGGRKEVRYEYVLPAGVVCEHNGSHIYRLQVQKQAGTHALPLRVVVSLPLHSRVIDVAPSPSYIGDNRLVFDLSLITDQQIAVEFR